MVAITGEYDFSQPLSTILREGTSDAHEAAEYSQGAGWLTRGELDKGEYIRFLMMLWRVYDCLERALETHASHPVLEPTYNPTLLSRAPHLASDISCLLQCDEATWQSNPAYTALLLSQPKPLTEYTKRLDTLASSSSPSDQALLLAHAYVRYLGDLSGGQVIKRRVAKAYGLDLETSDGIRFYEFKNLEGTGPGNIGDFKKIKEWYRKGMDVGAGGNETLKAAILDEANKAFEHNMDLLSILKTPTSAPLPTNNLTIPILGDPVTELDADELEEIISSENESKEMPIEIIQTSEPEERMVTLASVFTVVVAVCLAHFLLVTTGLTGTAWLEKLDMLGLFAEDAE